jgi:hypothetical protein
MMIFWKGPPEFEKSNGRPKVKKKVKGDRRAMQREVGPSARWTAEGGGCPHIDRAFFT